jgi:hypothetical protein
MAVGWPGTANTGGWYFEGQPYSWPGLGRNWARPPASHSAWVRTVFRGFLSGVLTVF